ncbi:MAG: c-type cytochrome domain-containing protein, partial [Pirellula sp.]
MKNKSIWMQSNPLASLASSLIAFTFLIAFLCGFSTNVSASDPLAAGSETQTLTYEKDVRPIFKAMCFHCHGEEPVLAGGLDTRLVRLMLAGGDSGPGLVHGNSAESLVWKRIESDEMPEGAKKLSAKEKETIRRWLDQGAKTTRAEPENVEDARYTEEELSFWAFQPPTQPLVPSPTKPSLQSSNPIDAF